MTTTSHRSPRALLSIVVVTGTLVLGACSAAAAPTTSTPPVSSPSPGTVSSGPPATADPGSGAGGGQTGAGDPGAGDPGAGAAPTPVDPAAGQPTLVTALPGRQNPHPVAPIRLQASVDGRHVLVKVSWYGGVAPCSVLDSVKVERSGTEIAITPIEGSSDPTAICEELAMLKATIVDLGELDPGTYHIGSPGSDVTPIEITIA